jgi:hypothetical protein
MTTPTIAERHYQAALRYLADAEGQLSAPRAHPGMGQLAATLALVHLRLIDHIDLDPRSHSEAAARPRTAAQVPATSGN